MMQSGGVSFFNQDEEGNTSTYSITVKFDPEGDDAPVITDNLGNTYVIDE